MIAQLVAAAALAAGPAPLLDAPRAQSVAVAGDQVVVTRGGPAGRLRVDALAADGSTPRRLLATRRLRGRWTVASQVFASPQRVAVVAGFEAIDKGPEALRWRVYTGPLAGPLELAVEGGGKRWQRRWFPIDAAVDGDRVLVSELRFRPGGQRLRLLVPGAAPRRLPWGDEVFGPLALAGDHVAFNVAGSLRMAVADLQSGAREVSLKVDTSGVVDVTADGTVVGEVDGGLVTAAPGRPRTVVVGSENLGSPHFAGARIAAIERTPRDTQRPAVLDPGASAPRPVGVVSGELAALDADARGVAWIANGCVLYAPVDAVAPAEPPAGPCPRVEVRFEEADQTLRGRRLRVEVDCLVAPATGCNGTLLFGRRGRAGRARFHVASGETGVATVRLERSVARTLRRRVQRQGDAAILYDWRVRGSRPNRFQTLFVVDRVS